MWIFAVLAAIMLLLLLSSCGTEKKLLRQKVKADSTVIRNLQTDVRLSREEVVRLESELKQAQYSGVVFDSTPCPPVNPIINVDDRCNVDSVRNALQAYSEFVAVINMAIEWCYMFSGTPRVDTGVEQDYRISNKAMQGLLS